MSSLGIPATPPQMRQTASPFATPLTGQQPPQTMPALTAQTLPMLEQTATIYYCTSDNAERARLNDMLMPFTSSLDALAQCRFILENSTNEYALVLASSSLLKLITKFFNTLSTHDAIEFKNFLLNYLASHYNQPQFVITPIIQSICRLVKLGWRIDGSFSEILTDVNKFLGATSRHHRIGLSLMAELTHEMNENRTLELQAEHRKTARSFRDTTLLFVFQLAMESIRRVAGQPNATAEKEMDELIGAALALSNQVLAFDFIGSALDESQDDLTSVTIQIPAAWRTQIEDLSTCQLYFDCCSSLNASRAAQALDVCASLASMRKSIFSSEEKRLSFLAVMIRGVHNILQSHSAILADADVFHSFCILLARIKSNYALPELARLEMYDQFLQLVASFTLTALSAKSSSPHSMHYLLIVWSRVVAELPHLKIETSPFLNDFLPQLSIAWITSRLDAIAAGVKDDSVDELLAEPTLSDQLRQLPALCRYNYEKTKVFLQGRLDALIGEYSVLATQLQQQTLPAPGLERLQTLELQLALMIHIWAAIIAHDSTISVSALGWEMKDPSILDRDRAETCDAEICAWYFQTMPIIEFRLSSSAQRTPVPGPLALASISFLQEFRKRFLVHIMRMPTEQKQGEDQLTDGISNVSMDERPVVVMPGFEDTTSIAPALVHPLVPIFGGHSSFIPLLSAISADMGEYSYTAGSSRGSSFFIRLNTAYKNLASAAQQQQQLTKHAITQTSIIANMLSTCLLFLNFFAEDEAVITSSLELLDSLSSGYASSQLLSQSEPIRNILANHRFDAFPFLARAGQRKARLHTAFYLIIGRVLFKTSNVDHFNSFMQPFNQAFAALGSMSNLRSEQSAQATIALCSKLQGLLEACQSYVTFSLVFDWLYPQQLPIILRLAETFADHERVAACCLRLYGELVFNRSQRIRFDAISPNGVILFKEAAKLVQSHTNRLLTIKPETQGELYKLKIKGVALILTLVARALSGGYVNFGLMAFYEDKTLPTTFTNMLRLILSLQSSDLLSYPMLCEPYFSFMEVMFKQHMGVLLEIDSDAFWTIVKSLHEGLTSFSLVCSTHAASALDFMFTSIIDTQHKVAKLSVPPPGATTPLPVPAPLLSQSKHITRHLTKASGLPHEIFASLMSLYLFDHPANQYTLSRPIFSLLCFDQTCWAEFSHRLINAQPIEARNRVSTCLQQAVQGITFNLDIDQKENFYASINRLRSELAGFAVRIG